MNKLVALFFIAVSAVVLSQNKRECRKISIKDKNDKVSGFNFTSKMFTSKMFTMEDSLRKIQGLFKKVDSIEKS